MFNCDVGRNFNGTVTDVGLLKHPPDPNANNATASAAAGRAVNRFADM
jgi:hypothetical protein